MTKPTPLFIVPAVIEVGTGLALAILPSATASMLLGVTLDTPSDWSWIA